MSPAYPAFPPENRDSGPIHAVDAKISLEKLGRGVSFYETLIRELRAARSPATLAP